MFVEVAGGRQSDDTNDQQAADGGVTLSKFAGLAPEFRGASAHPLPLGVHASIVTAHVIQSVGCLVQLMLKLADLASHGVLHGPFSLKCWLNGSEVRLGKRPGRRLGSHVPDATPRAAEPSEKQNGPAPTGDRAVQPQVRKGSETVAVDLHEFLVVIDLQEAQ